MFIMLHVVEDIVAYANFSDQQFCRDAVLVLIFSKRNKEQALLCTAKKYTNQLEQQKQELEQAENFPENCDTEVSKLRQQLLRYGNELQAAEERCEQLSYNIQW